MPPKKKVERGAQENIQVATTRRFAKTMYANLCTAWTPGPRGKSTTNAYSEAVLTV